MQLLYSPWLQLTWLQLIQSSQREHCHLSLDTRSQHQASHFAISFADSFSTCNVLAIHNWVWEFTSLLPATYRQWIQQSNLCSIEHPTSYCELLAQKSLYRSPFGPSDPLYISTLWFDENTTGPGNSVYDLMTDSEWTGEYPEILLFMFPWNWSWKLILARI